MKSSLKKAWTMVAILALIAFGVSCAKSEESAQDQKVTSTAYEVSAEDSSYIWQSGDGYI